MADLNLFVSMDSSSSAQEVKLTQRFAPSLSVSALKRKLEIITAIPPSCQQITLRTAHRPDVPIRAVNEDAEILSSFGPKDKDELLVSLASIPQSTLHHASLQRYCFAGLAHPRGAPTSIKKTRLIEPLRYWTPDLSVLGSI